MTRLRQYRMVEGIGSHWNKRWEIQEKYEYFENGEWVYSWYLVFWSSDKTRCEEVFEKYKVEVNEMIELKDLLEENETLVTFHLCNEYWSRNAITVKGNDDISGALEMTLHRILEAGGTEDDVKRIMGAEIPTEDELKELEEFDEFSWIDLGYVLPGLIDLWEESEVD